eukprot:2758205-Rhodomonas_salina.1
MIALFTELFGEHAVAGAAMSQHIIGDDPDPIGAALRAHASRSSSRPKNKKPTSVAAGASFFDPDTKWD